MKENKYIITLEATEEEQRTVITKLETETLSLDEMYKRVDCSIVDIKDGCRKMQELLGFEICLVFDEEFLLTNAPIINKPASLLFGYSIVHSETLCGNVIIAKNGYDEDGECHTIGLNEEELFKVISLLMSLNRVIDDVVFIKHEPNIKILGL